MRARSAELVEAAKRGEIRYVIAYSSSRLTRRVAELEDLIKLHEPTGVVLKTVVFGERDLSTAAGRTADRIKASADVAGADRISERQKAAFRQRAVKVGAQLSAAASVGWMADGKTIEPDEAALIRASVSDLTEGHSTSSIAKKWMK